MQDLNDLVYFAEVVDRGGFAAAGRALGLPKSRLSRRVAELEARLGVRLLQRTTRKLSMTAVGEQYHRHCVAMREDAQAAADAVAQAQTEPRGIIRVACPVTLAQTTLGPILPQFLARYPQVRIDMRVSNRVVDLVEEGFDVALRVRPTLDDSGSLVVKNFGTSRTLLVASPAQLARQGQPAVLEDLARLDTVNMSVVGETATWQLVGPDGASHALQHRPRYVADDLMTLKFAVLAAPACASCLTTCAAKSCAMAAWSTCCRVGDPSPASSMPCFRRAGAWCPPCGRFLDFLGDAIEREGLAQVPAG
jgi:DNA-binding transcriptional LysR family regulator